MKLLISIYGLVFVVVCMLLAYNTFNPVCWWLGIAAWCVLVLWLGNAFSGLTATTTYVTAVTENAELKQRNAELVDKYNTLVTNTQNYATIAQKTAENIKQVTECYTIAILETVPDELKEELFNRITEELQHKMNTGEIFYGDGSNES